MVAEDITLSLSSNTIQALHDDSDLMNLQSVMNNVEKKTNCQDIKPRETRGQRPNESQKAVIIYMMKSVGEIASKMWPVV